MAISKVDFGVEDYIIDEMSDLLKGERLLTDEEVRNRLGVNGRKLQDLRRRGRLEAIRISQKEYRYRPRAVLEFEARSLQQALLL